jgi:hypothetical protein
MSFTGKSETFLNTEITNDGFYPDIKLGELQRFYRVPAEYKQDVIEHHTRLAISDCNAQLAVRKAAWIAQGHTMLEQVDAAMIGDELAKVEQYKRAVFCRAVGLMVMAFATLNRREVAENQAKESEDTIQYFLAQSGRAIRRLLGLTENVSVELL